MEERATILESLVENAGQYTKSSIELLKLKALEKSANMLSFLVSKLILLIAISCITMLVNIGAALWIGKLIGNSFCGFFIVAAFYSIVVIVISAYNKQLLKDPLCNYIISHIRKEKKVST